MIKKMIMIFMIVIMMSCGIVMAKDDNNGNDQGSPMTIQLANEISYTTKVVGLENAMLRVRNEEQKQHIEQVMEKVQLKRREMLNNLEDAEIVLLDDKAEIVASGKAKVKLFGFIPMQKMMRYDINKEGEIVRQKKMFDFMFRIRDEIE